MELVHPIVKKNFSHNLITPKPRMEKLLKESLWNQFGASLDMLENAIRHCPQENWDTDKLFWYNAYHCLFFTDYYLTLEPSTFAPPAPFSLSEFEDVMPERTYTQAELLTYVEYCREKCHALLSNLTLELAATHWINVSETMDYPLIELILYNMRHVQHHAAQLNLILRQDIDDAPKWVSRGKMLL